MKEYIAQHKIDGAEDLWEDYFQSDEYDVKKWWENYFQSDDGDSKKAADTERQDYRIVSIGEPETAEERRHELHKLLCAMSPAEITETIVTVFNRAVNGGGFMQGVFNREFNSTHRTIQQSIFRKILSLIHFMASDEYYTDPRNEESKKMAEELDAVVAGRGLPFI